MKNFSFALGAVALTALAGCAPQGTVVSRVGTAVTTNERLSVASDGELRVGFYLGTIRDDCSQVGKASIRPTVEPVHGRLVMRAATDVPRLVAAPNTARAKCAGKTYPGTLVTYKPRPGYTGDDQFAIDVIWPTGVSVQRTISVQVR